MKVTSRTWGQFPTCLNSTVKSLAEGVATLVIPSRCLEPFGDNTAMRRLARWRIDGSFITGHGISSGGQAGGISHILAACIAESHPDNALLPYDLENEISFPSPSATLRMSKEDITL